MQVEEREARVGIGWTHFSQHFGASSTSKSIVISPSDVSRSTDMSWVCSAENRCLSQK